MGGIHRKGPTLAEIVRATGGQLRGDESVPITGIRHDSRDIEPGDIFVARAGDRVDGLDFVDQAVARGACAVMAEQGHEPQSSPVPVLVVADVLVGLARAAAVIYGDPTRDLSVIGITGTNGKTTTSALVRQVLEDADQQPALMGTFGACLGDRAIDTGFNTPEADELTRIAAAMRDGGASHLIMEVTSHALARKRTDGVCYRVAAYTNLTHDHLDLHGTFEAYGAAKARLFLALSPQHSVVMIDDDLGASLAGQIHQPLRVSRRAGHPAADVFPAEPAAVDHRGIRCPVITPAGQVSLESPLLGRYNLSNLLLALAICLPLGIDVHQAARSLSRCPSVPGRLERCDQPADELSVFVDYAHTPDALEQVLHAARALTEGQLICVFGCGGDRDRSKRPLMGEVAGRLADIAVVTSDNPRTEPPEVIAEAIRQGLTGQRAEALTELDRGRAIELAIRRARAGDVVLIAGKGHETEQIIGTRSKHFDDREQARAALAARRSAIRSGRR